MLLTQASRPCSKGEHGGVWSVWAADTDDAGGAGQAGGGGTMEQGCGASGGDDAGHQCFPGSNATGGIADSGSAPERGSLGDSVPAVRASAGAMCAGVLSVCGVSEVRCPACHVEWVISVRRAATPAAMAAKSLRRWGPKRAAEAQAAAVVAAANGAACRRCGHTERQCDDANCLCRCEYA